ncbi:inactive ubiquitin carboxyl-terminal hydrolase MINDY-4B [Stegostoma tigrinum]|uniref:inactive ubiquitin carboxyl-terminal hydrolase MINDY-4B n=1 Tax=Stegostoma tigrinum TaxID=3053191 RepID=UPI00202B2FD3|nr:inactive ubiquitin carboxyl-terminal hydrolase MINDY-4B [Stegostoma tigrinum]
MDEELGDQNHHFSEHDLDAITNKISDLGKWREIFSQQGLQFKDTVVKKYPDSRKVEDESEDGAGTHQSSSIKSRSHFTAFSVPYCVPKAFVVSSNLGSLPITLETAVALRKALFGTAFQVFNYEWKKSHFKFRDPYSDLAYALQAERGGIRSIQMAVQAYILKYLLFTRNSDLESQNIKCLLGVSLKEQENALAAALSDILWTAGEGVKSFVCLVTADCYFAPTIDYKTDSYTERLQLFQFTEREKLQNFIAEHIHCFKGEGSHAVILFLYSLLLSRTLERLYNDMDCTTPHLLQVSLGNFVCTQALINLMLTGRASPNVFNGDLQYDNKGVLLKEPKHGVLARSDVGYLYWNRHELDHEKLPQVGSMLKTPKLPIWLCNINDTFSVLFNTNRLLLSDWRMEHLFDLYFYSGQSSQTKTVTLTIDTHSHHWEDGTREKEEDPEKRFPSVEMTIRTKWEGAAIDWNGTVPFF